MWRRYLSLLILIAISQSVLCGFNSVSASAPVIIKDLIPLSKIATTLGDKLSVVGIIHEAAHSTVMAGNFVSDVKFVDSKELSGNGDNGFIVAYDGNDKVLPKTVINNVTITKLSNTGTKFYVSGVALKQGSWCGATVVKTNSSFSAVFERNGEKFDCKSITQSTCSTVYANEANATLCTDNAVEIWLNATTKIQLTYGPKEASSTITLRHLIKSGTNYFLVGEYKGEGDFSVTTAKKDDKKVLVLSSENGLFVLLIKASAVEAGLDIPTGDQKFAADFVRVTGERVIVAATAQGGGSPITFDLAPDRTVSLLDKGVMLFDLAVAATTPVTLVNTWAVAYPLGNVELRDMAVLNKYVFLAHDQPESLPLMSTRNVAVSALDLESDTQYTFVHSVSNDDLRAGTIAINEGALLLTGLNYNHGSLELMFSETKLPVEMTRPVVEPPRAAPVAMAPPRPSPPPVPVPVPVTPPVAAPKADQAPVVPVANVVPVSPVAAPKADQAPVSEPKAEVIQDNTSTFSSSYVIIAVVILTVFLVYFGLRFWRQYRAERQRQYGRVRMEDRIREDDFYNP